MGGASGFGCHRRIEGYLVQRDGRFGATLAYYNGIPPTRGLVFGMELGYLPYSYKHTSTSELYWAIIDLGWSFDL